MTKGRKVLKYVLIALNILAVVLLWLSGWSSHIDPQQWVFPAFLGLAYPFILLVNLAFILVWLLIRKRLILIPLIGIALGYNTLSDFFQINLQRQNDKGAIKVMNYNVRLFDLYNWSHNKQTRNKIFDLLKSADADIYCFQEFFYVDNKGQFETRDTMVSFLRAKNYREAYTHKIRGGQYFGVATFTAFPIVNSGVINFSNDINNVCLYTDLLIKGDTVRVYNLHIASIRFSYDDYKFVKDADLSTGEKELEKGARTLYRRLADAFKKRSKQSDIILAHIAESPYPVMVCGDFNDSPVSYCYRLFSAQLTDSFKEAGNGIGNTYSGPMPSYRIDYIFHDNSFKAVDYRVLKQKYSDHLPIIVKLNFNPRRD